MTTKQQVKIFMSKRKEGETQAAAAGKAGVSERTGRRIGKCGDELGSSPRRNKTGADIN